MSHYDQSRRRFLKTVLASGMLAATTAPSRLFAANKYPEKFDVIVVGAGIAGLAAASLLQQQGAKVKLLEARDRVGGRIWTDKSLGLAYDLGAATMADTPTNPLLNLASSFEIKLIPSRYENMQLFNPDGSVATDSMVNDLIFTTDNLSDQFRQLSATLHSDISVADGLQQYLTSQYVTAAETKALTLWQSLATLMATADLNQLSLQHMLNQLKLFTIDRLPIEGYAQLTNQLANGLDLSLNQAVENILYNGAGVTVSTDKQQYKADYAITTLPVGVLKSNQVTFSPPLPQEKQRVIARLGSGVINKIVLQYDDVFWAEQKEFFTFASDKVTEFPVFMNSDYYHDDASLIAYIGAGFAKEMEARSDASIVRALTTKLKTCYGNAVPLPSSYKVTRWDSDPFALGSHSYLTVGATPADYTVLANTVGGRIYFAGEATHIDQPATVQGAYLSGLREADKLLTLQ